MLYAKVQNQYKRQNTDAERELKARRDWLCGGKVKGR